MKVLITQDDKALEDISFENEEISIGVQADCDIHLPKARISDRQARFFLDDDHQWYIENLDPQHEIQLNNQVVAQKKPLQNEDQITLGGYRLQVFPVRLPPLRSRKQSPRRSAICFTVSA